MKAIILAAGLGSRLGEKAKGRPKALQRVGGRALIEHQLEALSAEGVGPVVVVVGHAEDQIRTVLGESVEYVVNDRPDETNSLFSLWLARNWLEGDVLILNSDLLFHPEILKRLLKQPGSALAFDSGSHAGAEQTKVGLSGSRVTDLGKDFPETGARGENLGLIKLDRRGTEFLLKRAEAIIAQGGERTWVTEAVRSVLAEVEVTGVNMAGLPWVEIDFPYDLDMARRQVWPEIQRSLHPARSWVRKGRLPLGAAAVLGFAALIWGGSAQLGPASVDWESLVPTEGAAVDLQRLDRGSQRWWRVARGESATVAIQGNLPLRVEARPLLIDDAQTDAAYVLELTLNGEIFHYEANRGAPDGDVSLDEARVGERDRDTYEVPPGRHELKVTLLAGAADAVLVRIRQPD